MNDGYSGGRLPMAASVDIASGIRLSWIVRSRQWRLAMPGRLPDTLPYRQNHPRRFKRLAAFFLYLQRIDD